MLFVFLYVQRLYIVSSRQLKRIDATRCSFIYSNFSETIVGSDSVRAYAKQTQFIEQSNDLADKNNMAYYASKCLDRWVVCGNTSLEWSNMTIPSLPRNTSLIHHQYTLLITTKISHSRQ